MPCWGSLFADFYHLFAYVACLQFKPIHKNVYFCKPATACLQNNIVPGGKAGEVPSGGFVPYFDGLGRFLGLSDDLGQIFYNSAKIATKEVFLNP